MAFAGDRRGDTEIKMPCTLSLYAQNILSDKLSHLEILA